MKFTTILTTLSFTVVSVLAAPAESPNGNLLTRQNSGCYPLFVESTLMISSHTKFSHSEAPDCCINYAVCQCANGLCPRTQTDMRWCDKTNMRICQVGSTNSIRTIIMREVMDVILLGAILERVTLNSLDTVARWGVWVGLSVRRRMRIWCGWWVFRNRKLQPQIMKVTNKLHSWRTGKQISVLIDLVKCTTCTAYILNFPHMVQFVFAISLEALVLRELLFLHSHFHHRTLHIIE
jgi:hypothetical protein